MLLTPTEERMWQTSSSTSQPCDEEINAKFEQGDKRIVTEINREKLPQFAEALKKPGYMDTRPFYQRRDRWDQVKQSRLIESFLINIPVPPIILYEQDYNCYEVMDGQQRINAIRNFYENKLALEGLEIWTELNGKRYNNLPPTIKSGIDRRAIQSIVILKESKPSEKEALYLKQITFERINTGGVKLSNQEVRNALYSGKFNDLLLELTRNPIFAEAWNIPINDNIKDDENEALKKNKFYKTMEDVELVLRFFALRSVDNFQYGMKGFLDLYMRKSRDFSSDAIQKFKDIFVDTIKISSEIYGRHLFKPFQVKSQNWEDKSYKAFYDSVMVGFSNHLQYAEQLISKKSEIIEATKKIFIEEPQKAALLTGKARSKQEIQEGVKIISNMLDLN